MKYFTKLAKDDLKKESGAYQLAGNVAPVVMGYGGYKSKQKGEGAGKGHARSALYSSAAGGVLGSTVGFKETKKKFKARGIWDDAKLFKGKKGRAIVGGLGALGFAMGSPIYHGIGRLFSKGPKGK